MLNPACVAAEEDNRVTTFLMSSLIAKHPEWKTVTANGRTSPLEWTYDGKSSVFTSAVLPLLGRTDDQPPKGFHQEDVFMANMDGTDSRKKYNLSLTLIETCFPPAAAGPAAWAAVDQTLIRALDTAIFSFARWQACQNDPSWHVVGSKAFKQTGEQMRISSW